MMIAIARKRNSDFVFERLNDSSKKMLEQGVLAYGSLKAFEKARNYAILNTTDEDAKSILRGVRSEQLRLIEDGKKLEEQLDTIIFDKDVFKFGMQKALVGMSNKDQKHLNEELKFNIVPFGKIKTKMQELNT